MFRYKVMTLTKCYKCKKIKYSSITKLNIIEHNISIKISKF